MATESQKSHQITDLSKRRRVVGQHDEEPRTDWPYAELMSQMIAPRPEACITRSMIEKSIDNALATAGTDTLTTLDGVPSEDAVLTEKRGVYGFAMYWMEHDDSDSDQQQAQDYIARRLSVYNDETAIVKALFLREFMQDEAVRISRCVAWRMTDGRLADPWQTERLKQAGRIFLEEIKKMARRLWDEALQCDKADRILKEKKLEQKHANHMNDNTQPQFNNCTIIGRMNNINDSGRYAEGDYHEHAAPAPTAEAPAGTTADTTQKGRPTEYLFTQPGTCQPDEATASREADRLISLLNDLDLDFTLNVSARLTANRLITALVREWQRRGMVSRQLPARALVRFLIDDCGISFKCKDPMATYGRNLTTWLGRTEDEEDKKLLLKVKETFA